MAEIKAREEAERGVVGVPAKRVATPQRVPTCATQISAIFSALQPD